MKTISFPLGRRFLLRQLAQSLRTIPDDAMSMFRMYSEGTADISSSAKIAKIVNDARREWLVSFERALDEIGQICVLPMEVYATGDEYIAPFFIEYISSGQATYLTTARYPFRIHFLDSNILNHYSTTDLSVSSQNLFLTMEAIFVDKIWKLSK